MGNLHPFKKSLRHGPVWLTSRKRFPWNRRASIHQSIRENWNMGLSRKLTCYKSGKARFRHRAPTPCALQIWSRYGLSQKWYPLSMTVLRPAGILYNFASSQSRPEHFCGGPIGPSWRVFVLGGLWSSVGPCGLACYQTASLCVPLKSVIDCPTLHPNRYSNGFLLLSFASHLKDPMPLFKWGWMGHVRKDFEIRISRRYNSTNST